MAKSFGSISQYLDQDPAVSAEVLALNALLVTRLTEAPNDISVAATAQHSILMSLSGSDYHDVKIGANRRTAPTRRHDVACIPAGIDLHSTWITVDAPLRTLSLEFSDDLFLIYAPEVLSEPFSRGHLLPRNYTEQRRIADLTRLFADEMDGTVRRGALFSDSLSRLLALELAASSWSAPARPFDHGVRPDRRINRAIDYMKENFADDLSLNDIASAAGLSPTHLTALMRRHCGMTPYAYVIKLRVELAVHLLRTSDLPIAVVALEAGFADQQHLNRVMRARRNQTPKEIRFS